MTTLNGDSFYRIFRPKMGIDPPLAWVLVFEPDNPRGGNGFGLTIWLGTKRTVIIDI